MKHYFINNENVDQFFKIIANDGVFVANTETVFGIFCNASSSIGCNKIFNAKERDLSKKLALFMSNKKFEEILNYSKIHKNYDVQKIKDMYKMYSITFLIPFDLSFLLKYNINEHCYNIIDENNESLEKTFLCGIRIPKNDFFLRFFSHEDIILASTSANISGRRECCDISEISEELKNSQYIEYYANFLDLESEKTEKSSNKNSRNQTSSIINISSSKPSIVRQGCIEMKDLNDIMSNLIKI